mmetsp:Transcript_7705/g.24058  ORF Transcript_7705/g.24058 Transcript_7705/m.24058 type:complete len:206 (-) Transcript_7705:109-726(-)
MIRIVILLDACQADRPSGSFVVLELLQIHSARHAHRAFDSPSFTLAILRDPGIRKHATWSVTLIGGDDWTVISGLSERCHGNWALVLATLLHTDHVFIFPVLGLCLHRVDVTLQLLCPLVRCIPRVAIGLERVELLADVGLEPSLQLQWIALGHSHVCEFPHPVDLLKTMLRLDQLPERLFAFREHLQRGFLAELWLVFHDFLRM